MTVISAYIDLFIRRKCPGGIVRILARTNYRRRALICYMFQLFGTAFLKVLGICLVLGQNGSGQNGMDKMVWTKWYTGKMVLDKMAWTKWYGQNDTDKILRIRSSINPSLIYNMIFSSIPLPLSRLQLSSMCLS